MLMHRYEWISHISNLISQMMKLFDLKAWYGPAHPVERQFVGKRKHDELKQSALFRCCPCSRRNTISLFASYPFFQPPLRVIRPLTRSRSALTSNNEAMWRKSLRLFQLPSLQDVKTLKRPNSTWLKQHCFGIRYITKVTYDDPLYSYSLWLLV